MPKLSSLNSTRFHGIGLGQSMSISPIAPGQQAYTTAGTYYWLCPDSVTRISVVCVGPGGNGVSSLNLSNSRMGGGGGGLGWKNDITVSPGRLYTIVVGGAGTGQASYFRDTSTVVGYAGSGYFGGSYVGTGGGVGGNGFTARYNYSSGTWLGGGGGGGAGGYTGNGGRAGQSPTAGSIDYPENGSGGGGAGGWAGDIGGVNNFGYGTGGLGGGVGIFGEGPSGQRSVTFNGGAGGAGSNGSGILYGGGGSGSGSGTPGTPGGGAVRIIWAGTRLGDVARAFPSTNTADL